MAAAAEPITWQTGQVELVAVETYRVKTFTVQLPDWRPFKPGQHFDVRVTAPDGREAQRSYSIASAPEEEGSIDLTIENVPDGEVSAYFHEAVGQGDEIELRGPIGGPFSWTADMGGPLLLVAGGSGVVPLMSMLRHRQRSAPDVQAALLYSSRSLEDVIFRVDLGRMDEIDPNVSVLHTLTRSQPAEWDGYGRRVDRAMLSEALGRLDGMSRVYVCGSTGFVGTVARELVGLEVPAERILTERFG